MKELRGGVAVSVEAPLNRAIGQRLRALREERRMRREQLALALEMSSENLRNYEAGKQKLTLAMLPTIAAIYGISLENLLIELFELRGTPSARPDPDTTRHPDSQSNGGTNDLYGETGNRREVETYCRTSRVLAMA